ncbi:MAG TPA: GTP cyclohydrolase FolE2, partial [Methylococcaceae bacterium]|nr:GTP cyclohydrolase FolE2 [Methylococcaceae bacterium]
KFADTRRIAIDRVGIRDIRHPVRILQRDGNPQASIATFNMGVDLPHHQKGTHMSRFVETLGAGHTELDVRDVALFAAAMTRRLEARRGYVEAAFPFFVGKRAPVSTVPSWMDYQVTLAGEWSNEQALTRLTVVAPVTSLCPCSKKISDYGAHNQRSHVSVAIEGGGVWIEEIIDLIEGEASCELYGLLKRSDEKYVTERAYNNPKFVEDMVRDIACRLNADPRVRRYRVETENFESIHNHSAYAMIEGPSTPRG